MLEKIRTNRFESQGQGRRSVHDDVDPQKLQRREGCLEPCQNGGNHDHNRRNIHRQLELDETLEVLINTAAPLHGLHDGGEGIVQQHHVAGFLSHVRSSDAHGDAHVRVFDGRRVVDAVAGDRHHILLFLQQLHHPHLDERRTPGNHLDALQLLLEFLIAELFNVGGLHSNVILVQHMQLFGNGPGRTDVVAGQHLHFNAGASAGSDGLVDIRAQRIGNHHKAVKQHVLLQCCLFFTLVAPRQYLV